MELGFSDNYFARALAHTGWFGRRIALTGSDRLRVWEARHREAAVFRFKADDPRIQTGIGARQDGAIVLDGTKRGTGIYGPYIDLPAGSYMARIGFRGPSRGSAVMDIAHGGGKHQLAERKVTGAAAEELRFEAKTDLHGVEVRLFCGPSFAASLGFVEIVPVY